MKNPSWHRDEIILALDLYFDKNLGTIDKSNPKIIELSNILRSLPLFYDVPQPDKFRNPNGVTLKLSNFKSIDPDYTGSGMSSYSKLDEEIFNEFNSNREQLKQIAREIRKSTELKVDEIKLNDEIESDFEAKEGTILLRVHRARERNPKLVRLKKQQVLKERGALKCEVCNFDFKLTYGKLGEGFIECHHTIPIAEPGNRENTKLEDLALVCSNCHRMIHSNKEALSIKQLQDIINVSN